MKRKPIIPVDTGKLRVGMVVPNYKEMCKLLGETEKTGNAKVAQLRNWEKHFEFLRDKQEFAITEVYPTPKAQEVRKSLYTRYIEKIICGELARRPDNTGIYTHRTLYEMLGFHNDRYTQAYNKSDREVLKINGISHIPEWMLRKFNERTEQKMYDILSSAFRSMETRELLVVNKQRHIVEWKEGTEIQRVANDSEFDEIKGIERDVLLSMNLDRIPSSKWLRKRYFEQVNNRVRELYDWTYVYRNLKLVYGKKQMAEAVPMIGDEMDGLVKKYLAECRISLNSNFIEAINKQAVMLCNTNKDTFSKYFGGMPKPRNGSGLLPEDYALYPDDFLEHQYVVSEVMLRLPAF